MSQKQVTWPGEFCGAWATVLTARLSSILGVLFLFVNLLTVTMWLSGVCVNAVGPIALKKAKNFDAKMGGIPVCELLVKAFLLRTSDDTLSARYVVMLQEREELEKKRAALKADMEVIEARLGSKNEEVERLAALPESSSKEAEIQKNLEKLESGEQFDMEYWKNSGSIAIANVQMETANSQMLTEGETKELDSLIERVTKIAEDVRNSESVQEAMKTAQEAKELTIKKAKEAKELALKKAKELQDSQEAIKLISAESED